MTIVYAKRLHLPQSRLFRPSRAFLSAAARKLLAYAAKTEYGVDIAAYCEKRGENGKPYLDGAPFFFNLSHSGDYAVCALSDAPVGVDIEKIVPISLKVMRRFFGLSVLSPSEQMRLWTRYESYGKMEGCGIPYPKGSEKPCFYKEYRTIRRYIIAVCSEREEFADHIILVDDDAFELEPPEETVENKIE